MPSLIFMPQNQQLSVFLNTFTRVFENICFKYKLYRLY
jgi:hypothetical protein